MVALRAEEDTGAEQRVGQSVLGELGVVDQTPSLTLRSGFCKVHQRDCCIKNIFPLGWHPLGAHVAHGPAAQRGRERTSAWGARAA